MPFFFFKKREKKKKSDECIKEELKRATTRIQVLKLFFSAIRPWWIFRSVSMQACSPNWSDQPSLDSNIRAKPEPCNLQILEVDQGIESSDGQSWKERVDEPTHTHLKNHRHQMRRNKKRQQSSFAMCLGLGSSFYFFSSKNQLDAASSTAHSFALLKDNELPVPMAFALAFFFFFLLFRAQLYAVNSWNAQVEKRKRQPGSLPCSPLEASNVRRKHPLSEHKCTAGTCIEPLDFLSS